MVVTRPTGCDEPPEILLMENPAHDEDPIVLCTDSQSALCSHRNGPWPRPLRWTSLFGGRYGDRRKVAAIIFLQCVPSHGGVDGNERAHVIAKEVSSLDQTSTVVNVRTKRGGKIGMSPYRPGLAGRMVPPVYGLAATSRRPRQRLSRIGY